MLLANRLRAAITKPLLPVAFFLGGVTFDSVTLTRIDRLRDNLIMLLYLSLLGGLIVLTTRADLSRTTTDETVVPGNVKSFVNVKSLIARAQPHYPHAIQFLLGGLFSAYTVFYSPSASLTTTAIFFAHSSLIAVLVGFYFLKWTPPVPLSLKFAGAYHKVAKVDEEYQLEFEKAAWYHFWKRSDDPIHGEGPTYCFTAVFAPVALHTTIFHRWQHRAHEGRDFSMTDRIPIVIAGGREKGYRGYTVKQRVVPGDWRVDVETAEGRVIGRVSFRVEEPGGETPELETVTH